MNWKDAHACANSAIKSTTYVCLNSEWKMINEHGSVQLWARTVNNLEIGITFGPRFRGIQSCFGEAFLGRLEESRPYAGLVFKFVDTSVNSSQKANNSEQTAP
jgi:hypothetical protein